MGCSDATCSKENRGVAFCCLLAHVFALFKQLFEVLAYNGSVQLVFSCLPAHLIALFKQLLYSMYCMCISS